MDDPATQPTVDDVRQVFRLVQQCRERWADRLAWQQHLLDGVLGILDAHIAALQLMRPGSDGDRPHIVALHSCGWPSAEAERLYRVSLLPESNVELPNFEEAVAPVMEGGVVAFSRRMAVTDEHWYASDWFKRYVEPSGLDEFGFSMGAAPTLRSMISITGSRALGDSPIPRRAIRQLGLLAEEIIPLIGTELTMEGQAGMEGLTPRQRETLEHLIDGLSEKQVAVRMGISQPTVHDYVVQLHRHFDVSSRAELLSYFIHRRPKPAAD